MNFKIKKNAMRISILASFVSVLAAGMACTGTERLSDEVTIPDGALKLAAQSSSLSAVALKNGKVEVAVSFPDLQGYATLGNKPGAWVKAKIDTLNTGNLKRDQNIKTAFFEVGKSSSFSEASFRLRSIEGDMAAFKAGDSLDVIASGDLVIHDSRVMAKGTMLLSLDDQGTLRAKFKGKWDLSIEALGMSVPLKNLNAACPQPHQVADTVQLKGQLVFVP